MVLTLESADQPDKTILHGNYLPKLIKEVNPSASGAEGTNIFDNNYSVDTKD